MHACTTTTTNAVGPIVGHPIGWPTSLHRERVNVPSQGVAVIGVCLHCLMAYKQCPNLVTDTR